jgi:solute:Na+ symporter, SSS family
MMLGRYYPAGMLGLGITALLASFMSGMAGNVTAFNTVWTYDIYQSYLVRGASDAHYLTVGRATTVVGIAISVATAYVAMRFNNIMDMLQLVFSFVNAPLFATFLLGMFWRRATGHGAFFGLVAGTTAAALHYELTAVREAASLLPKLAVFHTYPSDMAQNFWGAIWAWTSCFTVTVVVSLVTPARPPGELTGLVYSLTPRIADGRLPWYTRPATVGLAVLALTLALNVLFW